MNKEIISQSPDQQELLILENNYKVASVIDYHVNLIVDELKDLTNHFFKLGYHLFKLKDSWDDNLTKSEFYKFCESKFFLKSTSIKNLINVYNAFKSKDDEDEIDERFEGFSFTSLVELLPLADDKEFAKNFKKLSTRQIKEITCLNKDDSKSNFLNMVYCLIRDLLRKNCVDCILIEKEETWSDTLHFELSDKSSIVEIKFQLTLEKGVDFYGNLDDELFYLRTSDYLAGFSFWSKSFQVSQIEELVDGLVKAINDYAKIHKPDEEKQEKIKEKFVPTGAVKRLNLKKKDIVKYATDKENFKQSIIVIPQLNVEILSLEGCDYIFAIKSEPKNEYDSGFSIVDSSLSPLNNYSIEDLMLKE